MTKISAKASDRRIDVLRFLDPGRRKTMYAEQMMRHPEGRIRVGIELDGLAFTREVIESAGFDGLPDLALRDGFPLVQISVCHKNWPVYLVAAVLAPESNRSLVAVPPSRISCTWSVAAAL